MARARNPKNQTGSRPDADIAESPPKAAQVEENCLIRGYKENY